MLARTRTFTMVAALAATTLVGGATPADAGTNCSVATGQDWHWSHVSCLDWTGSKEGMRGEAHVDFDVAGGFAPSHVITCFVEWELISNYGSVNTAWSDCTTAARSGHPFDDAIRWGLGRRSRDVYRQYVWLEVNTGRLPIYSSETEAAVAVLRKP